MDERINIKELKEKIKKFCDDRDWEQFHGAKDLAIGIITESSELLDLFKFKSNEEIKLLFKDPKKREHISEEISDIFYYLLRFAQINNIDLSKELMKKMDKNDQKYPIEKAKGSNKKYNEL